MSLKAADLVLDVNKVPSVRDRIDVSVSDGVLGPTTMRPLASTELMLLVNRTISYVSILAYLLQSWIEVLPPEASLERICSLSRSSWRSSPCLPIPL